MRTHGARLIAAFAGVAVLTACTAADQSEEHAAVETPGEPSVEPSAASADASADDQESASDEAGGQATTSQSDDVLTSDAEPDLRYDIGTIDEIVVDAEGTTFLRFNRWQRHGDGASGVDFSEPPINAGVTDVQFVDENPALRAYPVSARVSVSQISNYQELCEMSVDEAEYVEVDLPTLVEQHPDALVTLSFDEFGEVFVVSDERSC